MTERFGGYETRAEEADGRDESVAAEQLREWLPDLLPRPPAPVLDLGAGCGGDSGGRPARGSIANQPMSAQGEPLFRKHLVPAAPGADA